MHINTLETTRQVKILEFRTDVVKQQKQKFLLTSKGISDLNDDARVYSSIGRMFALTTVPQVREDLEKSQEKCDATIKQWSEKKEYLMQNLKEQEDGLRELVKQKKTSSVSK